MEENKHTWKEKFKVYVVGGDAHYANWVGEVVETMEEADIVLFTGGEDVDPELYGKNKHPLTRCNRKRDDEEICAFNKAKGLKKHLLGICRGSQFLCVMSGGELIQHQENPLYIHNTISYDLDETFEITSTHHQAQYPYCLSRDQYKILAWTMGISNIHEDGNKKPMPLPLRKECEIVYYRDTNALAIQGHPESMYGNPKYDKTFKILNRMMKRFMNNVYKISCGRVLTLNNEIEG